MSYLKSIFQIVFNLLFLSIFFVVILFSLIIYQIQYLIFKTKYESVFKNYLFRIVGKVSYLLAFIRLEKKYHSKYDSKQSYIIVGNHNATMDIPINTSSCPKEINMKFLSKIENTKIPILGPIVKGVCVLVDRNNKGSRVKAFHAMHEEIKKGYSIFLYPEGSRNRTDKDLKVFYNGAFRLAIEHQLPIVVNTLVGTKKINSSKKLFSLLPGKVISHWEEPISTEGLTKEDIPMLKEKVKTIMINRLKEE